MEPSQDASAQIQKAARRVLQRRNLPKKDLPYFDWVVALPNISRAEWRQKNFEGTIAGSEILLKEDLVDPVALRSRLEVYMKAKAGYRLPYSTEQLNHVREALGSSNLIRARQRRSVDPHTATLGSVIDKFELKDKRLSAEQIELIEAEFDGRPQLVRGVAGSGKSVVLVRNFAQILDRSINSVQFTLDTKNQNKRFAIVCFNRSLVPFLRKHFEDAFRSLTYRDPPDCVDIYSVNKLQWMLSRSQGGPLAYQRYGHEPPEGVAAMFATHYSQQLDVLARSDKEAYDKLLYDAIYVDEGQDLFDEEYLFLMRLLRTDARTGVKNIVIFYDDAQNVYGRPRPTWSKLGIQITGRRTYVMKTCFRNSKPIIDFAFNLLLGVKAETRVLTKIFADVAYLRENGLVEELPDRWQANFADRVEGSAPTVSLFSTREDEKEWLIRSVSDLVQIQNVNPDDILILFCDPSPFEDLDYKFKKACPSISRVLKPFGRSDNPAKDQFIFVESCLTMTTVESAKGYDSPVVFVIGADLFSTDVAGRALFYVASTRCKMKLYVSGLKENGTLAEEAASVAQLLSTPQLARVAISPPSPALTPPNAAVPLVSKVSRSITNLVTKRLHRGDRVRHPALGEGVLVSDPKLKVVASEKAICQMVDVQFGALVKRNIPAELEGLVFASKQN
ncbi:ATP-binding domain-containing protein [Granulicella sp. dw_53]|uniref:ATP-binding domain-containing protein n=1 Tax=Granulicella sp. dw_53 TaxID=2719792 RepID=UPI001BD2EE8D|nr:ATP-binding domain-containing protein [Granulicella sp. dw_53]